MSLSEKFWKLLHAHEGGLIDDPDDPGGITKFGVSRRSYPHLDIRNLTWEQAQVIFTSDYFKKPGLDAIPDPGLQEQVMDVAINSGAGRAFRLLHGVVGTSEAPFWTPALRAALAAITSPTQWQLIRDAYCEARVRFFKGLALKRPKSAKYLKGWLKRARAVAAATPRLTSTP